MGIEKKTLSMRLDDEVIEALKILSGKENRTVSNYIETILKKHIKCVTEKK